MKIYFGIDCAPGSIRPDTYAERVFEKLGVDPIEAYSKLFGAWEWEVDVDDNFNYESFKTWMKAEMDELYNTGRIRGSQWDKVETGERVMSDNKMTRDDLGNRMKTFYEQIPKTKLMRRTPVIIRIDGKAFHTFTRGFRRPFDDVLIKTMQETTKYLCENIQGCVLGYCQSDEISLVLIDYQRFETSAWFDYEVQKMCSISASMATFAFNKCFALNYNDIFRIALEKEEDCSKEELNYLEVLEKAYINGAMFDARVFNIPKEEATNYFYWRQLDASRNSIQMVGQANFSHKELQNKSCNDIQDMLMTQKGINWNDFPTYQKRGSCVVRKYTDHDGWEPCIDDKLGKTGEILCVTERSNWIIDKDIPIFKGNGREYIEQLINVGEE